MTPYVKSVCVFKGAVGVKCEKRDDQIGIHFFLSFSRLESIRTYTQHKNTMLQTQIVKCIVVTFSFGVGSTI